MDKWGEVMTGEMMTVIFNVLGIQCDRGSFTQKVVFEMAYL